MPTLRNTQEKHSKPVTATRDYSLFLPKHYLQEYYLSLDPEKRFLLEFLHKSYARLESQDAMLELSVGPSVAPLISARNKVKSIIFANQLRASCLEVRCWKRSHSDAFNWDKYFEYVRSLEDSQENIESMKAAVRNKLRRIIPCNLVKPDPVAALDIRKFGIVSCHFSAEAIAADENVFFVAMQNIVRLANVDGYLLFSFIRNAASYTLGDMRFPTCPVNEVYVADLLMNLGCRIISTEICPAEAGRAYNSTFCLMAQRKPIINS